MEQPFSTSKVTVEYFDPHDVYKLIDPGLAPRLPLRNLHWQSHSGPLRSIDVLYVELLNALADQPTSLASTNNVRSSVSTGTQDDGFQTQQLGSSKTSTENIETQPGSVSSHPSGKERRHQIPGLRRTPYLKVLLVRCDDNDTYKATTRGEIREWIKQHTPPSQSTRKANTQENHDAFEWLIVHVVVPNTTAANQPRFGGKSTEGSAGEKTSAASRWRTGSSTLLEKLRADFNVASKGAPDRVAQIRIGINDVPYDLLPRVVPVPPSGYQETEKDAEAAWHELITKFRSLILSSFDNRVTQYEDDIREKDAQRLLPGWNFCTFFILKEGLARGFESVGLVEDALVGYDELSVGLDTVIHEQIVSGDPERNGGALLLYTEELRKKAERALGAASGPEMDEDEEPVDLQSSEAPREEEADEIPISSTKKLYRDMIVANNVSIFDFRCYIFSRQISLLLRLGNGWSSRSELLAKIKEQQDTALHGTGQGAQAAKNSDDAEVLTMLAEVCRRTLQFIPAISQVMRVDLLSALVGSNGPGGQQPLDPNASEVIDNLVASFAFSVSQQILAQTSTQSLPIPASSLVPPEIHEPKAAIPEPKTMMHPARSSSLHIKANARPLSSPGIFPGPGAPDATGRSASVSEGTPSAVGQFLKSGLEELAARRAELYSLSRNLLEERGKKRGWGNGWISVPEVGGSGVEEMENISLDDDPLPAPLPVGEPSLAGIESKLLRAALDNRDDFYRLFETLTDKALRHFTVADHHHAVQGSTTELAILKFYLGDYSAAAAYFHRVTPFFGESGWSALELSMLVMYCKCLEELQRKDDYVRAAMKLLSKAAAAQKDYLARKKSRRLGSITDAEANSMDAVRGVLSKLTDVTKSFSNEVPVPLGQLFNEVGIEGQPEYENGRDGFSLVVSLNSLLADELAIEQGRMRLVSAMPGIPKELWVECAASHTLQPGKNTIRLHSKTSVAGSYDVDRLSLVSNNIHVHYERDIDYDSSVEADGFNLPHITVYRPAGGLDCQLKAAKDIQLDRNNGLDLKLSTGWNSIKSCEIRVRPNTGGLRLLTTDAKFIGPAFEFAQPPESGLFTFGSLDAETTLQLRFPFSTEQDVASISVRVEVNYTTEDGTYSFWTTPSVPVGLALGVNVQDVFKKSAVFSRFSVSTASPSPLLLYKSELIESEIFEAHFGAQPSKPIMVFPKQPASLLYKVVRKPGVKITSKTAKTLYLKIRYSIVLDEILAAAETSLNEAAVASDLAHYTNVLSTYVRTHLPAALSAYDLEKAALLGDVPTSPLVAAQLGVAFNGLGKVPSGDGDASIALTNLVREWHKANPRLKLAPSSDLEALPSILIPVDVPSVPVHCTVDMELDKDLVSPLADNPSGTPVVGINQLVPANLKLDWTRKWDTSPSTNNALPEQEFSYDITAPADTWLLGGRKRGRVVVSASDLSVDIPVLLVPLREGWLPYPNVEIHEARDDDQSAGVSVHCETDHRNLGETVRVIADREKVTLSLDASGPGGGPLVLESERKVLQGRIVV